MEKINLKSLIVEQKERFLAKEGLLPREVLVTLGELIEQREIVFLSGVRRCGKSSLMRLCCDELGARKGVSRSDILYLNFEDERLLDFSAKDFEKVLEVFDELRGRPGRAWFFLDEIQNVKGWEKWLNRLYEFEDVRVVVTGSNASLIESEVSSALTGRNRQIAVHPLSFREILAWKNVAVQLRDAMLREDRVKVNLAFAEFLRTGGFPEVVKTGDMALLDQYLKDILYRDVIARRGVRNAHEIKELCLFLSSNIGTVRSYKNLKDMVGARSLVTIKNYLDILEQVYLFFGLDLFDYSVKKRMYNPSKIYSIDAALTGSMAFRFSENAGRMYENAVFVELMRRGEEMYYWKSAAGKEVDFVCRRGKGVETAIQVCFDLADVETRAREFGGLHAAKEELGAKRLLILTEDEDRNESGIDIMPLWKWMLAPNA